MGISYDANRRIFHLKAKETSYVMQIVRDRYLAHVFWGRRIDTFDGANGLPFVYRTFSPNPDRHDRTFSLDTLPQEYPGYGTSDFRSPAFQIQLENGSTITDLRYHSHAIFNGKKELAGLPATYVEEEHEAVTLQIELEDRVVGLKVFLLYTVFEQFDAITRSVRFENGGKAQLRLLRALSASVDFRESDYEWVSLYGAHANECNLSRVPLLPGIQSVDSKRGASSHQHQPFFALVHKHTTESSGEAYGFSFVYSGNFLAQIEVDQFSTTRVSIGINPFDFSWLLEEGKGFQTPEVVMVYSSDGLGAMSRTYHALYRSRLCRGVHRDLIRPILINNWEATYFKFTERKIVELAEEASTLGIELCVLDDGWFGKRDNSKSSLGDWVVNLKKLPNGLADLAKRVRILGLEFGLWFEPEMVSVDSDLYRKHPDWCLHVPNRSRTEGRSQLVLDLSRKDVCEYIVEAVSTILASASITYVKWDMNRHCTEIGSARLPASRQRETAHRYMLGLYRVMDEITSRFPEVLFESCSGGGGRFDPGMLYYMPQTWTSDNTDAISRLKIQYGTSFVYPPIAMGAHVSAVPNHQVHRLTSLEIRGHVAMSGNLGYELDLTKLSVAEKEEVARQVKWYKGIRHIIQFGDFYRLESPFSGNHAAWMFVSVDQTEAIVCHFSVLAEPNGPFGRLKLVGLKRDARYALVEIDRIYGGDELMFSGISLPRGKGDFTSVMWWFKEIPFERFHRE